MLRKDVPGVLQSQLGLHSLLESDGAFGGVFCRSGRTGALRMMLYLMKMLRRMVLRPMAHLPVQELARS
jgi:hypothetical protein